MVDGATEALKDHSTAEIPVLPGRSGRTAEEEATCEKLMRGEKLTRDELVLWLGEPPETFWPRFFNSIRLVRFQWGE